MEKSTEEVHILEALERNGYPSHLVQRNQRSHILPTVSIPYVQGQSEAIRCVLQGLNMQTSFAPATSLRNILSHLKDPVPSSSGVVYQIPCADCNKSYIGQTGRNLSRIRWRPKE